MTRPSVSVAMVLAGIAMLAAAGPAYAAFPGANGKIAFVSDRNGSADIYEMNADGSAQAPLTNNPSNESDPAWSPDGTKIAFRDGRDGNYEIYVMNADGTGQTNLTNNSANNDDRPAWSPDGSKIAFVRQPPTSGDSEIYVMNADGTGQANATNDPANDGAPAWSPDGSKIAFTTFRNGDQDVYVMNADGTGQTDITNTSGGDENPAWSPDGSKIAFDTFRDGYLHIYTMNADGTAPMQITTDPAVDNNPEWSPDGTKLVFATSRDGNFEVYSANADGTGQTNLTNYAPSTAPNSDLLPDWQPLPAGTGFPRPKGATPFQTYLTVAYEQCTVLNTNRTHGGPLDVLACNPPQQQSMFLTVGTLDANGQAANAIGVYRLDVKSSPADVKMSFALKDVRNQFDLSDYTGELRVGQLWRITDKNNGPISGGGGTDPATNQDLAFPFDVTCAATADEAIGSTCDSVSSANAVVPGSIQPGMRMNTQLLDQVQVQDGGSDGVAATTADNTLFMDQGIFVP